MKDGPSRRKLLAGTGLVSATAAASALLSACTSSSSSAASGASVAGNFPKTPAWQFWFVNHVYSNPFFVPTQYGFQDAAALLGLPTPKWGGSASTSSTSEMVSFLNTAIAAKASGIATTVIDATAFTAPVKSAMDAGIPVISYNADGTVTKGVPNIGTNRLCYVGQALYNSGQAMGNRIKSLITTPGEVVIFIATPGTGNIQPRYDGAAAVLTPAGFKVTEFATGAATSGESAAENAYILAHKSIKGAFAVDAGSTQFLGPVLAKNGLAGKIPAGGFDLTPGTLTAIKSGQLNFTIDQNPYLQGFLPVMYLYLFNLSGGLLSPPNTDTGLTFVTKDNVGPYQNTTSRFEGSTTQQKLIPRSGPIVNPPATTST
jgi:simple sugar transport system substrate-binding protein